MITSILEEAQRGSKNIGLDTSANDFLISTLGPQGTCSEYASLYFISKKNAEGKIFLKNTFEEAIYSLIEKESNYVIIPSAYKNLGEIIFEYRNFVEVTEVFRLTTPGLVAASKMNKKEFKSVATHSTPKRLADEFFPDVPLIISNSNSHSVKLLLSGKADACITTSRCVEIYSLQLLHDFGPVSMGWNVFQRKLSF